MNTTQINSTQYEIYKGQAYFQGTYYSINEGKAVIQGTNHIIDLDKTIFRTVKLSGTTGNSSSNYITIDNITYYQPDTFRLPVGTQINCHSLSVRLNDKYQGPSYVYTIGAKNITIHFTSILSGLINIINIKEEP